jgi:hypothetical protein
VVERWKTLNVLQWNGEAVRAKAGPRSSIAKIHLGNTRSRRFLPSFALLRLPRNLKRQV